MVIRYKAVNMRL